MTKNSLRNYAKMKHDCTWDWHLTAGRSQGTFGFSIFWLVWTENNIKFVKVW